MEDANVSDNVIMGTTPSFNSLLL